MCCVNSIEGWSDTKPLPLLQSSGSASKRGGDGEGAIPRELSRGLAVNKGRIPLVSLIEGEILQLNIVSITYGHTLAMSQLPFKLDNVLK